MVAIAVLAWGVRSTVNDTSAAHFQSGDSVRLEGEPLTATEETR